MSKSIRDKKYSIGYHDICVNLKGQNNPSNFTHTNIHTDTIEEAKKIIKIAKLPYWEIRDMTHDSISGEVVVADDKLVAWNHIEKRKDERSHSDKFKRVNRINQLPLIEKVYYTTDEGAEVQIGTIIRDRAKYDPSKSKHIYAYVEAILFGGTFSDRQFTLCNYINRAGSVLAKAFEEWHGNNVIAQRDDLNTKQCLKILKEAKDKMQKSVDNA